MYLATLQDVLNAKFKYPRFTLMAVGHCLSTPLLQLGP